MSFCACCGAENAKKPSEHVNECLWYDADDEQNPDGSFVTFGKQNQKEK